MCTGGHGHGHGDTLECDGPAEFRKGARRQISLGADLIKVMISGGIAGEHEAIDTPQLQPDELEAVITTAHDWGRKVTAHAGPAGVIDKAVRLGLDCVEHGYQLTGDVARLMAERGVDARADAAWSPAAASSSTSSTCRAGCSSARCRPAAATWRATRWRSKPASR